MKKDNDKIYIKREIMTLEELKEKTKALNIELSDDMIINLISMRIFYKNGMKR